MKHDLAIQGNAKLIQRERSTGKNIAFRISNKEWKNDLETIADFLKCQFISTVDICVDKENEFLGLLYQDKYMKKLHSMFPEILLIDTTYKLLDLRILVYSLLTVDGHDLSEIVALFTLAEETKKTIHTVLLSVFKVKNESWEKTKVIMSDKDFIEREAFKDRFTNVSLLICLYHTLSSLHRKVTCKKMGVTSAKRLHTLEILQYIAYSKNNIEYVQNGESLQKTKYKSVADYCYENCTH